MRIVALKEQQPGDRRVALVPESVKKLTSLKVEVAVEAGAGLGAGATDEDYQKAGATISSDRNALLASADVLVTVNPPSAETMTALKPNTVLLGFLRPLDEPQALKPAIDQKLSAFSMELVPRTTRAQSMDALSSMATVAGYKAVVMAADRVPHMFPLLMTAAGTVPPAKVLVLGAGVAGLQAIATAKRLGAQVEAYDVRKAAGEQVKSLGANFLDVDLGGLDAEDAGGYAKELSPEALERGKQLIAKHAKSADVVITTAQIPGRPAPVLMNDDAVKGMKRGAVIVDLASSTGGNTTLTKHGETVEVDGVTIIALPNAAATIPKDASQMYSRNVTAFLQLLINKEGQLNIDMNDDIVQPSCVTHGGAVVNQRVAGLLSPVEKSS
jgi:NAD(P) transhydrogenase subunit alpha